MKTAYTNGKILNSHEDIAPVTGLAVLVDGATITGVIPDGEVSAEYAVVDLRGGYLMPGLINLHVHIPGSGKPAKKQADTKKLVKLITSTGLTRKIGMNMCASFASGADGEQPQDRKIAFSVRSCSNSFCSRYCSRGIRPSASAVYCFTHRNKVLRAIQCRTQIFCTEIPVLYCATRFFLYSSEYRFAIFKPLIIVLVKSVCNLS